MIRRAWHRATRTWREAAAIIADEQARAAQSPAPPPFASPSGGGAGQHPVPGQQATPVPAHGRPPRPAPAPGNDCRFCHGTGWASLTDPWFGDAYWVTCPSGCPIPQDAA